MGTRVHGSIGSGRTCCRATGAKPDPCCRARPSRQRISAPAGIPATTPKETHRTSGAMPCESAIIAAADAVNVTAMETVIQPKTSRMRPPKGMEISIAHKAIPAMEFAATDSWPYPANTSGVKLTKMMKHVL